MKKLYIMFILFLLVFVISLIFPLKSVLLQDNNNSNSAVYNLEKDNYKFNFKVDNDNMRLLRVRFSKDDIDYSGVIHYKLTDKNKNVIVDKSILINDLKNDSNYYIDMPKQSKSKNDSYEFEIYYDKYNAKERFGIWVLEEATDNNYLVNDNRYGLEFAAAVDYKNYIFSWYPLAATCVCLVFILFERNGKNEKKK